RLLCIIEFLRYSRGLGIALWGLCLVKSIALSKKSRDSSFFLFGIMGPKTTRLSGYPKTKYRTVFGDIESPKDRLQPDRLQGAATQFFRQKNSVVRFTVSGSGHRALAVKRL